MIKCVIFDLDGTLLNTLSTITHYMNVTMERFGLKPLSENECIRYVGNGARNLVCRALSAQGITDNTAVSDFHSCYTSSYDVDPYYLTEAYSGIRDLLSELKKRNLKLAVLSNKPDFATRSVVDRFFPLVFDAVRGGRDNVALKPAPDGVFELLDELGFTAEECAFIGDSEVDVQTGINSSVGMNISATWGFRDRETLIGAGATVLVSAPAEVLSYI